MTIQNIIPSDGARGFGKPPQLTEFKEAPVLNGLPTANSAILGLNLENLKCFEVVELQFQELGIVFRNAIALHPSNPAFPAHSGSTVLLGAPKSGFLEIVFQKPACFVSGYITSSQRTILTAYDAENQSIAHTEMAGPNLAGSDSEILPNYQLSLCVPNISRVTFYAFDGQITVDDLSFDF